MLEDYEEWGISNSFVHLTGQMTSTEKEACLTLRIRLEEGSMSELLNRIQRVILFHEETDIC